MNTPAGDDYESLREPLSRLVARVTEVNVARPIHAYGKIRDLRKELTDLRPRAEKLVLGYEVTMDSRSIHTMGDVMAAMPVLMGLAHRVNSLRLLTLELSSALDQKAAFSLAFFALYVSISSVLLSFLFTLL